MNFLKQKQVCCFLEFHSLPFIEANYMQSVVQRTWDTNMDQVGSKNELRAGCVGMMLIQVIKSSGRNLDKWLQGGQPSLGNRGTGDWGAVLPGGLIV